MARGKYQKVDVGRWKRIKRLTLILSIVLILSMAVGGTLAYLAVKTGEVENRFTPSFVTCQVNANNDDTIDVTNTGDIDAYIRAAIIVNWMDQDGNVRGVAPVPGVDYTLTVSTSPWDQDETTGFYYYTVPVEPNDTTEDLVTAITVTGSIPAGYELSVEVVAEAIQADGDTDSNGTPAYQDAWGIPPLGG